MERTPGRILLSPEKLWNTRECQVFPPFLGPVLKNNNEVSGKAVVYEIRREAKEIIDFVEEEIANIDDQILELQRKREELVQEGIPSWTILDACRVALSPFRRVPMEILQHIAVDALPAFPSPALNQSPMSLSHVCKNWRNAVLAFPEAWAALYLNIDIVHCNNLSWSSCVVTNWFDRAPNRPLSLYLHFDDETLGTQWPLDSLRAFFETLQPYFNRIHHLGLSADLTLQYAGFLNRHAFPNLRSLTMNITQYRRITDTVSQGSGEELTFEEAPRLRKLCLNDPAPLQLEFLDLEDATSPWSQITDLCLTKAIPLGDWLLILQICPHLRKATFYIEEGFGSHNVSIDEEFDHSALEDLRLNINDATLYLQPCFEMCSFPRLRTLHIYHCNDIVDMDIMSFPPEFSSLKTLVVTGDWYQSLDILELLLNSTSGLANLTLGTAVSDTSIRSDALFAHLWGGRTISTP